MEQRELNELLSAVAAGEVSPEDAAVELRTAPYSDLGFAKVDHHRGIRQGVSEVIYGEGKTPDQIAGIVADMLGAGQERVLITRLSPEAAIEVEQLLSDGLSFEGYGELAVASGAEGTPDADAACDAGTAHDADATCDADAGPVPALPVFTYYDLAHVATVGEAPEPTASGFIVVATGGTSDIPVAEEAALTAEMLGNAVVRLYDVGVAGLHRLLSHADELAAARVVIAVAGMEGALPSVIGGLVSCPVIAVPTSIGYGASMQGIAALLSMLNSCASGVSVVNIDNGFGAGYQASLINHMS